MSQSSNTEPNQQFAFDVERHSDPPLPTRVHPAVSPAGLEVVELEDDPRNGRDRGRWIIANRATHWITAGSFSTRKAADDWLARYQELAAS